MAIPNFLIIGDLKAGSTSLYHYLRQHPEVYMPDVKELRYFAYDEENPYHVRAISYRVKTFSEYLRHFEKCGDAKAIGEASPNYLRSPGAANRIKAAIPDVRLIACLRNPADRLYSAYLMNYRGGSTRKPFDEELFGRDAAWIKARFYWLDLKQYFDLFPPSQIKIVLFDDLKADAGKVVKDLYRFLDVDDAFAPDFTVQNEGGTPKSLLGYTILMRGKNLLRRFGTPPTALKQLWRRIERDSLRKTQIDPQIRRKILEICQDDIKRTQELIGRDLSSWLR
jgi:hypothetical protein